MEYPWIIHLNLRSPGLTCLTTYYRWDPPSTVSCTLMPLIQWDAYLHSGRRLVWQHYGGWKLSGDMAAALWDVRQALGRCGSSSLDAKKKAWHGLYKGETAEAYWSIPIFIYFSWTNDEEWKNGWPGDVNTKDEKTAPDAETIWFSLIFEMVAENYKCCGALGRFATSLRKATWNCSRSFVPSRRRQMRRRWFRGHVSSRDAEAMLGPSWMYTTVYRWYMLIHRWYPTFCWFPILPPDLKKKRTAPFLTGQRCEFFRERTHLSAGNCWDVKPWNLAIWQWILTFLDISWHIPQNLAFFLLEQGGSLCESRQLPGIPLPITRHSGKKSGNPFSPRHIQQCYTAIFGASCFFFYGCCKVDVAWFVAVIG